MRLIVLIALLIVLIFATIASTPPSIAQGVPTRTPNFAATETRAALFALRTAQAEARAATATMRAENVRMTATARAINVQATAQARSAAATARGEILAATNAARLAQRAAAAADSALCAQRTSRNCSGMASCEMARACLRVGFSNLDRDRDGIPCETLCGG